MKNHVRSCCSRLWRARNAYLLPCDTACPRAFLLGPNVVEPPLVKVLVALDGTAQPDECVQQGRICFWLVQQAQMSYPLTWQIRLCCRALCRSVLVARTRRALVGALAGKRKGCGRGGGGPP